MATAVEAITLRHMTVTYACALRRMTGAVVAITVAEF